MPRNGSGELAPDWTMTLMDRLRGLVHMTDLGLITDERQVTAPRLTTILTRNQILRKGRIQRVRSRQWKEQQLSYLVKLDVEYSADAEPQLPVALVLKHTKPAKSSRRTRILAGREHRFYVDIARQMTAPPVPRCFDSVYDKDGGRAHLILEDLSETHLPPVYPLPPAPLHAASIVDCLAEIHGAWWNDDRLGTSIGRRKDQAWIDRRVGELEKSVAGFLRSFGDNLSAPTRRVLLEAMEAHAGLLQFQTSGPVTVTHGDAHSSNFLIPKRAETHKASALDWEFWDIEPGTNDLAALMGLNWYADMRSERERDLVARYQEALVNQGIAYSWDQCWDDYRRSVARHVLTPVKQQANGLQIRSWWPNLQRVVDAYIDLDCRDVIPPSRET